MKKIYLACSFACEDKTICEKRKFWMQEAENILEEKGFEVYNPSKLKIENAWDYSYWDWGNLVFQEDLKNLDECDMVVYLSYGKANNDGSVWEDAYAYAKGKPVLVVSMNPDSPESLMILHSAWACIDGIYKHGGLYDYDFEEMPRTKIERIES